MPFPVYDDNTVQLSNGDLMPWIGLGTFLMPTDVVGAAVKSALDAGYRHIDCAAAYQNEKEIGVALTEYFNDASNNVTREQVFVTSKLPVLDMSPKRVAARLQQTLDDLQLDYLDLYLVHGPFPAERQTGEDGQMKFAPLKNPGWGLQDVWRAMEEQVTAKKCKSIGVSNFPLITLNDVLNYCKIKPTVNQVERNPFFVQPTLQAYCHANEVLLINYSSLGSPGHTRMRAEKKKRGMNPDVELFDHPLIASIADKYKKTTSQILLRWAIDSQSPIIPKSVNVERQKLNLVNDFKLSPEDVQQISSLDRNQRCYEFLIFTDGFAAFA